MTRVSSIFSQMVQLFSRAEFERTTVERRAEGHARGVPMNTVLAVAPQRVLSPSTCRFYPRGHLPPALTDRAFLGQNLRIKTFVGSANALQIQIWAALIAWLLLEPLRLRARLGWSLSNLAARLRQQPRRSQKIFRREPRRVSSF